MNTELLNSFLYGSKLRVYFIMRRLTYMFALLTIGLLIYAHGVVEDPEGLQILYLVIDVILASFVLIYLLRILYTFERISFLKRTWFEAILMSIIFLNEFCTYILHFPLFYKIFEGIGLSPSVDSYRMFVSLFTLLLLFVELLETQVHLKMAQLRPSSTFLLSFIFLILGGTCILMLPKMTISSESIRFIDALFMATSASCITGMSVVDVGSYFTFSGQVVILMLIQLGGLGMLTFATFFASLMRKGMALKHHIAMHELLESESPFFTKNLMSKLILITLSLEGVGAVFVFKSWGAEVYFSSVGNKIFFSIFHAVSAFCNAGFSLFPHSLYTESVRYSYLLHLIIAALIILGGLGFPTILDVLSPANMRERMRKPWKNWKMLSRVTIYTSGVLLVVGTTTFFLLEYHNTLAGLGIIEALITSFFQSVTTRSAGFNTVDISALSGPCLMLFIILIFIGASPGSTGGGIKTSTFTVILFAVAASIRDKRNIEIGRRTIPHSVAYKAFSVFTFAAVCNMFLIFILAISDSQFSIMALAFEQVSAFSTAGLSTGITAGLSDIGKSVIIFSMYLGRVGTLTLALALSTRQSSTAYKYPVTNLAVG